MRLSWDEYLALRRDRLAAAGSSVECLPGWSCGTVAGLEGVRPGPAGWALVCAPGPGLPRRRDRATAARHDAWLHGRAVGQGAPETPEQRVLWARARLVALGERLPGEGRRSWTEGWRENPSEDAHAAGVLAGLGARSWTVRAEAEALLLRPVLRSFRGVCLARRLPVEVRERAVEELREAVFYRLCLPDAQGRPGWTELAARALETAGPVRALLGPLGDDQLRRAASCAASRGRWGETARELFGPRSRALRARALLDERGRWEVHLDTHLQLRLRARWAAGETDPDGDWRQVVQSRARARARLRALAGERPEALLEAVLALPALAARLRDAASRWAWAWAWEELARDFSFDLGRPVLAPCVQEDLIPAPWPPEWEAPLDSWLLLVLLRGRLDHLRRWAETGSTGDRDSTWGRLLAEALPPPLSAGGHGRLQDELRQSLPRRLHALVPVVRAVAKLPGGRGLKAAVLSILEETWSPMLPLPRAGFPSMQRAARALLPVLSSEEAP